MRVSETLRTMGRRLIPWSAYRWGASVLDRACAVRALGPTEYKQVFREGRSGEIRSLEFAAGSQPFYFRPSTPDVAGIVQNLIRKEWAAKNIDDVKFILDGGAYIGDTARFYLNEFCDAHVVVVEPNPQNLSLLEKNLAQYSDRVSIYRGGLWSKKCQLKLDGDYMGGRLVELESQSAESFEDESIQCFSIAGLADELGIPGFDIVKLDIEGSELEVLTENSSWLKNTRLVAVEFHGSDIAERCTRHLESLGFAHFVHRSVNLFRQSTER